MCVCVCVFFLNLFNLCVCVVYHTIQVVMCHLSHTNQLCLMIRYWTWQLLLMRLSSRAVSKKSFSLANWLLLAYSFTHTNLCSRSHLLTSIGGDHSTLRVFFIFGRPPCFAEDGDSEQLLELVCAVAQASYWGPLIAVKLWLHCSCVRRNLAFEVILRDFSSRHSVLHLAPCSPKL